MIFPPIYLASSSPRRRELLEQMQVDFSVLSINVDEQRLNQEPPPNYVKRVAIAKAQAGWDGLADKEKRPVLGADTTVVLRNKVLGKPRDEQDARLMLQRLSGKTHQVMTAIAVVNDETILHQLTINLVTFAILSQQDIDWYISIQEGIDKAGAYAVQGLAALFIDKIQGSYSAIMGLPIRETALVLTQLARQRG